MNRSQRLLAAWTTGIMFLMLLMGAWVTNTGSGMGCGAHWPLCKGTFMPDWDYEAIVEFSHRAVSGLGGLMTLVLAGWTWRTHKERPLVRWLATGALGVVLLQGLLGAAAVLWPQPKAVLALHFGISLVCFSLVLLTWTLLVQGERAPAAVEPVFGRWVWTVAVYGYGVVYLGAYVRHLKASAACMGWPLCNGQVVPPLYGLTGVSFIHRVAAALLVVMVVRLGLMARRWAADRRDLQLAANVSLVLVVAQVFSGAFFGLGYINLLTQMTHTALITLFFGALSYLLLQVSLGVAPVRVDKSQQAGIGYVSR